MARRAGMTTDLQERKKYWSSQYPSLRGWREYGPYDSREIAQEAERRLAEMYGCEESPGGRPPKDENSKWYAYHFEY